MLKSKLDSVFPAIRGHQGFELIAHSGSKIQGLAFYNMPNSGGGEHALGMNAGLTNATIEGCWFSITPQGTQAMSMNNINISGTDGVLIGGDSPSARNIISGSEFNGIFISAPNTTVKKNT